MRAPRDLRLDSRTATAVLYLGRQPHASSREIADAVGITDSAQAWRLLGGMRDLGLLINRARSGSHDFPDSWELTGDGRRLLQALAQRPLGAAKHSGP